MMTATGQLQHHFWGTYAASIALQFEDAIDAQVALPLFAGWHRHKVHADVLVFHGGDEKLEQALTTLEGFGADRDLVESCNKSIDYGEPFTIAIENRERARLEAHGQLPLGF